MKKKPSVIDVILIVSWIALVLLTARILYTLYYIGKILN